MAEGLVKSYGDVHALVGIDLEIEAGTIFGLLGPNGAGKTTAVRILATILRPDGGRVSILGHDVVRDPQAVRQCIGLAGQYAAVDENLTGRENLRLIGQLTHLRRSARSARADELLHMFSLEDAADRPARTYSGGMRRRLDLAAALVHRPPVLFLDEPTTGLDVTSRTDLWRVIEQLAAGGTTVLLTTQYLEEADQLASDLAVIDHGQVIARGTPAMLKEQCGATLIDVEFGWPNEAARASALLVTARHPDPHVLIGVPVLENALVRVPVTDGSRGLVHVVRTLDRAGLRVVSVDVREPTLDDVFLRLTGHRAEHRQNGTPAGVAVEPGARGAA